MVAVGMRDQHPLQPRPALPQVRAEQVEVLGPPLAGINQDCGAVVAVSR